MPESDLDALLKLSGDIEGVHKVRVYGRIGQMALEYDEPRAQACSTPWARSMLAIADAKSGYVMQPSRASTNSLWTWRHSSVPITHVAGSCLRRCVRCLSWPVTWHFCALPFMSWRSRA
ncbi:MAG: hypothetical protein ACLTXI_03770 [Collinsella sp.]